MSTSLFMLVTLFLSSSLCLMSNSWVSIWLLLEVNTLSFCVLSQSSKEGSQKDSETVMKYLIIQSIASAILVMTSLYGKLPSPFLILSLAPLMALMIKAAAAPLHQWFISLTKNISWSLATLLLTWQKLAPIYLMLYQLKTGILFFVILSSFTGAISMMNKKLIKEVLAWSSVFNLSWMLLALTLSTKVFFGFTILYWASLLFLLNILSKSKNESMEEVTNTYNKWSLLLVMANLAGLPPFAGFLAKWLTFSEGLKVGLFTIVTVMLMTSAINLYVYLRLINSNVTKTASPTQSGTINPTKTNTLTFFLINGLALTSILA